MCSGPGKRLIPALLLLGITSMISQIVLIRELLILFYGNELSIGIILANWLWWTACGSWLGTRISDKTRNLIKVIILLEISTAFVLLLTILGVRAVKLVLPLSPGEIMGFLPIWLCSFSVLSVLCILNGILFVICCIAYKNTSNIEKSRPLSIGNVYIFESLGAALGGIVCSLFLLNIFNALEILWAIAALNIGVSVYLYSLSRPASPHAKRGGINLLVFIILSFLVLLGVLYCQNQINVISRKWQWPNQYSVIASEDSIYGNITVTKLASYYSFYENGLLAFSVPDISSNEWTVHPAILQHPDPKNILLIGGGAGGALLELLKYPSIQTIDYTELDPLLIKLSKSVLPEKEKNVLNNERINIYYTDGRKFLKSNTNLYDVIIINLPDPFTAQINRFYTREFFAETAAHLTDSGIIYFGVTSAENYISAELVEFLRCIYYTLKIIYPEIKIIPGDYNYFVGSKTNGYIKNKSAALEQRLDERNINTLFVKDYYLASRLSSERIEYTNNLIQAQKAPLLNTDFHPICYYYDITFWSTYFNNTFKKIFVFMSKMKLWHFMIPVFLAFLWYLVPKKHSGKAFVLVPIAASGFSEISFQVVILLAFQVIYGYVYYKLGIILTSFMIGLCAGAYVINRSMPYLKNDYSVFVKTQVAVMLYPLLLPGIFYLLAKYGHLSFIGENIIFPVLPVIAGFVGGFQFPLGNKIYLEAKKDVGKSAGTTYGLDLFGACLGALFISAFVLPILGIYKTCIATFLINLSALIVIIKSR